MKTYLAAILTACLCWSQSGGKVLPNGIELPAEWPPKDVVLSSEPQPTPKYLVEPPAVIPIDTGRQLFVDYFLIEQTDLRRTFHAAEYYPFNPVMKADKRHEFVETAGKAMPFSDGIFYDPADNLFKAWYYSANSTNYATSPDGVKWTKPELDIRPGTNIVIPGQRDSSAVWLDLDEKDPKRRYKMLLSRGHMKPMEVYYSADGIHWGEPVGKSIPWSDRTTFFRNPFLGKWVMSLRDQDWVPRQKPDMPNHIGRMRRYLETDDIVEGLQHWKESVIWTGADRLDGRRIDLNVRPQLYQLEAFPYESLMIGEFVIWRGQYPDREKPNSISLGFSRDGFHWDRPNRETFLGISEKYGDWNFANVQSVGGGCLVVGDRLYFYVSGRAGHPTIRTSADVSTGLATLRRDGFASMDAMGRTGTLTTRPVQFSGSRLFVNVDSVAGDLFVEVLDKDGRVLPGFSKEDALPVRIDNTLQMIRWKKGADLSSLAGKPVRFRFHLREGSLYSFWVSRDESGASQGYVGAGGPGFTGNRDTVGKLAYGTCCRAVIW
jgi:hypothetical protein